LIRENKEVLYGSMVKDTLKRKHPSFTESSYGYSSFSELLEDARDQGIIEIARNQKAGGTWVVTGLGRAAGSEKAAAKPSGTAAEGARRPRTRRRGTGRGPGQAAPNGN
jgi:transposase InsO family protein